LRVFDYVQFIFLPGVVDGKVVDTGGVCVVGVLVGVVNVVFVVAVEVVCTPAMSSE